MRLLAASSTHVADLDRVAATAVGRLLAASGTSDIADAHVVVTARGHGHTVITSDADDIRRLDPEVSIESL
jgi:predicted nucleic acid-binding protein